MCRRAVGPSGRRFGGVEAVTRLLVAAMVPLGAACFPGQPPAAGSPLAASIAFFEARLDERPDDIVSPGELADRYLRRFGMERDIDDVERAERALARGLAAHPGHAPFLSRLVAVHLARHEFPEALHAARAAHHVEPRRRSNGPLFDAYFEVGQYDSARAALSRMDPYSFGYLLRKARYAEAVGRFDLAERALAGACRPEGLVDRDLRVWCGVRQADLAVSLGRTRRAERVVQEVLREHPRHPAALTLLATLRSAAGDDDAAEVLFRRLSQTIGGLEAHLGLARIAERRGDTDRAAAHRAAFEAAATDPRYGRAYWSHLALMYAEQGRLDEALVLAERDRAQRPGPETYRTLGAVLVQGGRRAEAANAVARALAWTPRDPDLLALRDSIRRGATTAQDGI